MAREIPEKHNIKSQAAKIVRTLQDDASWEDLMYQIYVRQKIEGGLADLEKGATHTHASIKKEFGLAS